MRSKAFPPSVAAFLVVGLLLIPPVFRRAVNGLVATANWTSYRIGWDWHRIHPNFVPRKDLMNKPEGSLHPAVPLFLGLGALNVLGLAIRRSRYFFTVMNLIWGTLFLLTIFVWMGTQYR
ncbi:MAG TPA: hypothetical protein VIE88_12990, partial [Vicinamibacteria bacterium]